jgi:glycerol 2-dehydrogenase (NADP+)
VIACDLSTGFRDWNTSLLIGRAKNIGVSNCSEYMLRKILPKATIKPAVDQVELHIYNPSLSLVAFLKSEGIVPQAYSPLGSTGTPMFQDELVQEIAKKHNAEPAQVLIGYLGT